MSKRLNAFVIIALSLLLVYTAKPRIESVYQRLRVIARTAGYHKSESEWSEIYFTDQDAEYIPLIKRLTDFYLPLILNDFNVTEHNRVIIIVYSDPAKFRAAVGQMDVLPMGAYYGGVVNIISPSLWMTNARDAFAKDYFIQNGPLIHELAHYAADLGVGKPMEPWLSEGVALYYEYKYTGVEWRPDLEKQTAEISVSDLTGNFRELDDRVAYRKAFDIIKAFVKKYGEDRLRIKLNR
ncbi:MAG: hypothetical protein LBS84_09455 [Clostridiales bacterium]|jgi:hypothetical protein|nr:hypothetical protein [Clostridiales bacterium]